MRQSMGTPKIWTLLGFCACLLCDPVISAAIPIATEGPGTPEYDYVDDDSFPWGTEEDYLDPTTLATTTERPLESQIIPQLASVPLGSEFPGETSELPGENPGSAAEVSTSSPVKKETLNSVQASDEDKVDSATEASRQPEIKPQEESLEETTKIPVEVEKELSDANSSQSSLEKGPVKVSSEASVESATTAILSSKETLVSIGEQPEESVLVSDTYPRVTGPIPAAGSGEETGASTSGEELDNVVTVLPSLGAEREKSFDTTTREIDTDDGLNPADASWDDTTDTIPEPNEETPELSPDGSKEASPNLEDPSSNTDELSPEEASTTSLDGSVPAPPPENSVITEETSSSESGPSALGTLPGLSESNELTAGSARPTAEVDLGAELDGTEGRGDTDGPVAASSDTETEDVPASPRPETSLESTGEVSAREPEGVADAETSNSPEDEPAGARSDVTSPSDAGSRPSDLGYNTASGIPVELPAAPVSFPLSEDDAAGAVAATTGHTEVTEVSGNPYSSEEGPMAEQGAADEGAKVPEGENISSRLDSATSSALNSAVEAAAPLDPAENDPLASGTQSEIQPSSNLEALTDTETSSSSALEAETVADARAASAEETSSLASPADALSDPSEEIAPNGAPGNDGWSSEDGEMASQSAEKGVKPTARSDGPRGTGLQAPDTGSGLPGALLDGNPPNQRPVEDSAIASPDIYSRGESSLPPKSPDDSLSSASDSDTTAAPLNGSPLEDSMTSVSDISSSGSLTLPLGSPGDTLSDTPDSDTTKALSNESPLDDSATDTWTSVESGLASESPSDTLSGPSDPDSDPVNKPPNGSLVEGSAASAADVSSSGEAALSSAPRKKPPSEALDSAAAGPPRNGPLLDDSVTSAPGTSSREDSALPSESVNDELSEASNPDVDRTDIPANGSPLDGSVPKASSSTFPSTSPNDALSSPSGSNSDTADAAPPGLSLEGSVPSAADTSSSENSVFPSKSPGDALSDASDSDTTEARLNGSPSKGSVPSAAEASSSENSVFPSKSPGDALSDASDSDTTEARLNGSPSKGSVPSAAEASSSENSVFPSKSPGDALSDASDSDTTEARLNGSPSKGSVPSAAEASSSENSVFPSKSPGDALSDASDSDTTEARLNGSPSKGSVPSAAEASSSENSVFPSKSPGDALSDASDSDTTEARLNGSPSKGSVPSAAEASSSENSVFPSKSPGDALSDASDSDTTEARLNGSPSKGSVPSAAEASSSEDSTHPSQSPNDALSDASDSDFDATQVSSNGTAPAGMAADTSSSERSALPSKSPADMLSDASGTDKTEGALNGLPLEGSLTSASVSQEETVTAWGNSPVTVGSSFRVDDGSLGSERAKEPSIANSAATSGGESGALGDTDTSSPFVVGSEASATSGERPSLSSLSQAPSGSLDLENEGGESALRPTAGNLAPSTQDSEVADGSRVGEGGTGTGGSESQRGTEASSSERELGPAEGTEPLVGKSGALATGEPPKKSSVQDGEVTASKEGSLSAPASPGEKSPLPPLLPGAEPSPNPGFPGAFATNDALPAESEAPELEEDPSVGREKEPPLASLATESQTAAYLGEGAGESQISSDPSETATSLHPLAAASQLPGSPEGEKTAATATHPGSVSSTEAGQSPENISEQLEQKSGLIEGGQSSSSSVDDDSVATIHKASGGTLPPSASTSSLGSLAAGAASNQKLGIMDSSQLASGSDGVGSPGLASSGEPTFSDGVKLSWSDSFSPVARAGAEVPNGVPGSGTAALGRGGGPAAAASPVASSPKSAPEHPSAKAGPPIGKVTGKMSASPSASETQGTGPSSNGASRSSSEPGAGSLHSSAPLPAEGRGDTGSFVSTISKGSPAARLQPGQKASPAKPAGKLGPDAETETSPQLSQTKPVLPPVLESQDLGTSQILGPFHPAIPLHIHPTRQLPTLQNRYPPQTIPSDEASSSSSSSDSVPSSPGNKPVSGVIRSGNTVASSSNKTDAHRAVGKVSSVAAKPSPTTRKPSGRKAELRPNARSGKMTAAKEKPVKSSQVPEASVPASAAKSSEERADSRESGQQEEQVPKANSRRSQTRGRARRSRRGQ